MHIWPPLFQPVTALHTPVSATSNTMHDILIVCRRAAPVMLHTQHAAHVRMSPALCTDSRTCATLIRAGARTPRRQPPLPHSHMSRPLPRARTTTRTHPAPLHTPARTLAALRDCAVHARARALPWLVTLWLWAGVEADSKRGAQERTAGSHTLTPHPFPPTHACCCC